MLPSRFALGQEQWGLILINVAIDYEDSELIMLNVLKEIHFENLVFKGLIFPILLFEIECFHISTYSSLGKHLFQLGYLVCQI